MIIVQSIENRMENNLVKQRKIGAQLKLLKTKNLLFFDFKKRIFYKIVFVYQLKVINKNNENNVDKCQKERKLDGEQ